MKKATFLRIAVFAVVVCALLVVSALADDNAKIIRFDGEGDLDVTPTQEYSVGTVQNGILHIALTNNKHPVLHGVQHKISFPIPEEQQFTLLEYPYVKIKFKTNYPANLQFYLRDQQKDDNNQYIYSAVTDGGTEKWVTAEMKVHTNVDYITGSYTGTSGKSYSVGCTGGTAGTMYLPSDEKPITVDKPFLLIKDIAEGVQLENVDYYFDLEYIAFFANEADMLAYERDAVIMRFDGNGNTHNGADTKWNITNDGTLKFEINTSGANGKTFTLTEKAAFTLYEYPYLSIKFRTQWPNNIQYYATQQGQPANGKGYYCAYLSNTATPTTNVMNTGDNNWYMTQFYYKPDHTSDLFKNIVKEDEEWWIVKHVEPGSNGALFPTKENPVTITKPFMQIKELATDLQGGKMLATEFEYIAYFKSEADMLAYIAEQTAMDNAVSALSDGLSYTMHPAMTTKALALALEAEIEADNANIDATVNANDYENGKVTAILSTKNITKIVTVDVDITKTAFALTTLGAQVRADANDGKGQGLRFGFTLDTTNVPAGCTIVEYGAVIGKGGSKPVIGDAENYAVIASTKEGFKSNAQGGITSYNAVITNIPEGQEGTQVTTRPYVTYKFGGADYTVYGEAFTRSVNEVLHNAINGWDK